MRRCFRFGNWETLIVLVNEGGCSPNQENHNMCTPLHIAASNARKRVVKKLLEYPDIDMVSLSRAL